MSQKEKEAPISTTDTHSDLSMCSNKNIESSIEVISKVTKAFSNDDIKLEDNHLLLLPKTESQDLNDVKKILIEDFLDKRIDSRNIFKNIENLTLEDVETWKAHLNNIYPDFHSLSSVGSLWGSFCITFVIFGTMNGCLGALQQLLGKYHDSKTLDLVFVLYFTFSFALMPFCESIFNKFNIISAESIPIGALIFFTGLVVLYFEWYETVGLFAAIAGLMALGTSILAGPAMYSAGTWFNNHLGKAQSLVTVGGGIGAIIIPYIFNLIANKKDISNACFFLLMFCSYFLTMAVFFSKDNDKYLMLQQLLKKERKLLEENMQVADATKRSLNLKLMKTRVINFFTLYGINQISFVMVILSSSITEICISFIQLKVATILGLSNLKETDIKKYYAVMQSSGVLGRLVLGVLADSIVDANILQSIVLTISILVTVFLWIPHLFQAGAILIIILVIQGFIFNGIFSITAICISNVSKKQDFPKRFSILYMVESLLYFPMFYFLSHQLRQQLATAIKSVNYILPIAAVISALVPFIRKIEKKKTNRS